MKQLFSDRSSQIWKKAKKHRTQILAFAVAVVVGGTALGLSMPATTATAQLLCGQEEHTHSDECYTEHRELTCGQEEGTNGATVDGDSEGTEGHVHTEDCYTTTKELTCTKPEHTHSEACYEKAGVLKSETADHMTTEVSYEAGVIHPDSSLSVKKLEEEEEEAALEKIGELLGKDGREVSASKAYHLTLNRNGNEIDPQGLVDVTMKFETAVEAKSSEVKWTFYAVDDQEEVADLSDEKTLEISTDESNSVTEIHFSTEQFATYVLIGSVDREENDTQDPEGKGENSDVAKTSEESAQKDERSETENEEEPQKVEATENEPVDEEYPEQAFSEVTESNKIKVTVSADKGALPKGTTMQVRDVKDENLLEDAMSTVEVERVSAKAVDISFYDKAGKEIEPLQPIRVTLQADVIAKTENVTVVHFDNDNNAEIVERKSGQALPKEEKPNADEVIFDSAEFSTYAIVYTVDFHYGEYSYSIAGGSDILLSELLEILHIYNEKQELLTAHAVSNVQFSDPSLIKITKKEENWNLSSLEAFTTKENLLLTLKTGEEIAVEVTDSQEVSDLKDLVDSVSIDGAIKKDGGYEVSAGDMYDVHINFAETINTQFNMNESLTYQLPAGFSISETQNGNGKIEVSKDGEKYFIDYTYTIDTNGKITIIWPQEKPEGWHELVTSQYARLYIDVKGVFQSNIKEIDFHAKTDGKVTINSTHNLSVKKSGTYNPHTNQIDYTVTVTSKGHNTNVNIKDVISGTALTYKSGSFTSSNNAGTVSHNQNGFNYHIDAMHDGETITLSYSADVNLNGITRNADGTYTGTAQETGNTVTANSNETPGKTDHNEGKDYANKISYSSISKSASDAKDTENPTVKQLTWTIKANENANVSMAGKKITDTINPDSTKIMKYSGNGIKITVKDKSGKVVEVRNKTWGELGINPATASTWSYQVPDNDKNYSYEIAYTTDVQASETDATTVHNGASDGDGNHADGSKTIRPTTGETTIKKEVTRVDYQNNEIIWKITLEIPAAGYDKYSVKDFYPHDHDGSINKEQYFSYKEGSFAIDGLISGETTSLDFSHEEYLLVNFFKDQGKTQAGLQRTDKPREITITITTVMSDYFKNMAASDGAVHWPQNLAHAYPGDKDISASTSARVQYTSKSLSKYNGGVVDNYIDGTRFPAIRYNVEITGITDGSFDENGELIFIDTYDAEYLTWAQIKDQNGSKTENETKFNGYVFGAIINDNYRFPDEGKSADKVITATDDGKLLITLDKNTLPRKDGEYYEVYTVPYYLTVKDSDALKQLNSAAASNQGGIYEIKNKVENDDYGSAEDEYDYTTDVLIKSASNPRYDAETGNYIVDYTLNLNPDGVQLGDENSLELVDESENLSINLSSIKATPSLGVSWDLDGNHKLVFTIPNSTPVTITYQAKIVGSGTVTYRNSATLHGQEKTTGGSYDASSFGGGDAITYKISIMKYEEGDVMTTLEGVEFDLYMLKESSEKGNHPAEDGKNQKPSGTDSRWKLINDTDKPFVTDSNGYIKIDADSLKSHDSDDTHEGNALDRECWYMLKEHTAPTVNGVQYELDTTPHMFWIDPTADVDYDNSVYANDDTIKIANKPTDDTKVGFSIKKQWKGTTAENLPESITIHLYQKDDIYALNDTAKEVQKITLNKSDFSGALEWTGEFKNLEKGKAYFIIEDPVEGFTATYEDENTIGYTRNGTISLTNTSNIELKVLKKWVNADGSTALLDESLIPDSVTVNLFQDGNKYGDPYTIKKSEDWELTISNLPSGHEYTVAEEPIDGFELVGITYSDDKKTATITNKSPNSTPSDSNTQLTVKKKWVKMDGTTELTEDEMKDLTADVELVRYRSEQQGTVVHFIKNTDSRDVKSYESFLPDIVVASQDSVTISIASSHWNQAEMFVLYEKPEYVGQYNHGYWDYVNNNNNPNKTKATANYEGNEASGTQSYTFSTAGRGEVYLFCLESLSNNFDTSKGVTIAPGSEGAFGTKSLDINYSGRKVTLQASNHWSSVFTGLPLRGTDEGVTYVYSYAVKEVSSSSGFTFESYSSGYNGVDSTGIPISRTSGSITITNKQKEAFELPHTGGPGATKYILSGFALVNIALLLFFLKRKPYGRRAV